MEKMTRFISSCIDLLPKEKHDKQEKNKILKKNQNSLWDLQTKLFLVSKFNMFI